MRDQRYPVEHIPKGRIDTMNPGPPLDTPYWLNPRVVPSIKSADSMLLSGAGTPLELPLDLFQVLMAFSEKKTAREAFLMLDVDVNIDEFGRIAGEFFDRGLLRRDEPVDEAHSLRQLLNPILFADPTLVDKIGGWLRQGRAIVIPDALPAELAERVHHDLDRSTHWNAAEGGHDFFHYRNCVIDWLEHRSPALTECNLLFKSIATRQFIAKLSGRDCAGEPGAAAAWYRPGEYALPHNDLANNIPRSVAYIWYLTKGWRQEWGGALFWCPSGQFISPGFNVLLLFEVIPSNIHLVCPVALSATSKRLSINGFWHSIERPSPSPPISAEATVSPRCCGNPALDASELSPVALSPMSSIIVL